jgi:hypothetical protein
MKDPDGVYECVDMAVMGSLPDGLSEHEREALRGCRREEVDRVLRRWVEYGEYLVVEIDTDAGTAIVVEVGRGK